MQYHKLMSASDKHSLSLNARHILVPDRIAAEDVLRHLKNGKDFQDLARKYSQCSSASCGGDLGNLKSKKNVDTDFMEALEVLKVGQTSGIVRTRFGYHLIQRY